MGPESNVPSIAVQVCVTPSWLTTVTTVPTLILIVIGLNMKLSIVIVTCGATVVVDGAAVGVVVVRAMVLVVVEVLEEVVVLVVVGAAVEVDVDEAVEDVLLEVAGSKVVEERCVVGLDEGEVLPQPESEAASMPAPTTTAAVLASARMPVVPSSIGRARSARYYGRIPSGDRSCETPTGTATRHWRH